MIKIIRIAALRYAHRKAAEAARSYEQQHHWNVLVQIALNEAETQAANRLILAINPHAITRAW